MLTKIQFKHFLRNIKQRLFHIDVGVMGSYHGANLGDIALGESVIEQLKLQHFKTGLQTIYNLEKWPMAPYGIIGGGAVAYIAPLRKVIDRYKGNFDKIGIIGIDLPEPTYPDDCIELFSKAAFISCRSQYEKDYVNYLTGREDIFVHPDIAFSLLRNECKILREKKCLQEKKQKLLLVNVVPLFGEMKNGQLIPNKSYENVLPDIYNNFQQMHVSYKYFITENIRAALSEGYVIKSISFTPEDTIYAKITMRGLPVEHLPYTGNPRSMLIEMANADWIISTRLHATIFALKLGIKITPIAYAKKNDLMLENLGFDKLKYKSANDFAHGKGHFIAPLHSTIESIEKWEEESENAIKACIKAIIS